MLIERGEEHWRAETGSHEWFDDLVQPAEKIGFETVKAPEKHLALLAIR